MKFKHFTMALLLAATMASCGGASQAQQETAEVDTTEVALDSELPISDAWPYVPSEIGDCYIGERVLKSNGVSEWCEITFYSDGNCELKTKDTSAKGTFGGTINEEGAYKIIANLSDGETLIFEGDQSHLEADDDNVRYDLSQEM